MSHDWFRSWHGAPVDAKWRTIAKRAGVPTSLVVSFMWALMDRASQADDRGSFAGADLEALADYFDCYEDDLKRIVTQCNARNVTCNGRFVAWEKRQPKRPDDNSKERVRAFRERQRNQSTYDDVTQCNAVKRNVTLDKIREDKNISTNVDIAREPSALAILSECMSETTAKDLIAHRQKLRKPLTPRAAKLLAKDFVAYGNPEEAAEMMIKNGWQGFHPTWVANQTRAGPSANGRGGMASLLAKQLGLKDGRESRNSDEAVHVLSLDHRVERGNERDDGRQLSGDIIDLLAASPGRGV